MEKRQLFPEKQLSWLKADLLAQQVLCVQMLFGCCHQEVVS